MEQHSVDVWGEILGMLGAPAESAPEYICAQRILGDLVGYQHRNRHRDRDARELANALEAYAKMLQDAGVNLLAR